ncbi:MAG: enoyl-CoA hydratase/isomerase family protein [Hyphomicrobium sp.]|nr:enoyl-CoA hydratase/isomerase family protein [Hyphomicrobium sp.]
MSESVKPAPAAAEPKVIVSRHGAVAMLTLNRPQALNAFDDEMRQVFAAEIPKIARNPDVYVVVLNSASPKAFSAGGDVRAIIKAATTDKAAAKAYFAGEYALNWLLDCFSKPTVSLIDGLCMGSGAGLTLYNTHRVAGENYKFAMPETAIGLFPDVGVAHPLARLAWPMGLYLGLTGRAIGRADGHWLGLATHCIAGAKFQSIVDSLGDAQPIDALLDDLHEAQQPGPLQGDALMIEDLFSGATLADIMGRLQRATGASEAFAKATYSDLIKRSPLSLAITDRHIRSCRNLDLRETLIQDYRLGVRCIEGVDFAEGVRAALIDKDGAPKWQHARIEDVTEDEVAAYFAPLGDGDLKLLTRSEMQSARV